MRYGSKQALLDDIRSEHDALVAFLGEIPSSRYREAGVWGDAWTVCDLLAHLAEWHRMFLRWYEEGASGALPQMPAPGYRWGETPALNRAIQSRHEHRSWKEVETDFESSYDRVLQLAQGLTPDQLLKPGQFDWTGRNALSTYLGANTTSHYRFAMKVLKRWRKGVVRGRGRV